MAGSWGHITDEEGRFAGIALIENLGDAYEALEECYGMVQVLARELTRYRPVPRQAIIEFAVQASAEGLEIGGRNEPD